jgi:hypothetical protein
LVAAVLAVLMMVVSSSGSELRTTAYTNTSPSATPAKERCDCDCNAGSAGLLCTHPWDKDTKACTDYSYEFDGVTDPEECKKKEGRACRGYFSGDPSAVRGRLEGCEISASPT